MTFIFNYVCILACITIAIAGCSPSIFSNKNENDTKITNSSDQKHCQQIKLENNELSITDFKNAVHCLNQDRSLNAFENLINEIPKESLEALVSYLNQNFVKNTDKINYWNSLISDGFLNQLSYLAQNKNFVDAMISIFQLMDDQSSKSFKLLIADGGIDQNIRGAIQFVNQISELESFQEISSAFSKPISHSALSLNEMTNRALLYFKNKSNQDLEYTKPIWFGLLNGNLIKGFQRFLKPDFDIQIQKFNELIEYLHVDEEKDVYPKLRDVFYAFNRSLSCYQGTKKTINGDMHIFLKLNDLNDSNSYDLFLTSEYLKFIVTGGFCNTPKEAQVFADVLSGFSEDHNGRVLRTSVDFVKAMTLADESTEIYRRLLIDSMADRSKYSASFGLTEPIKEWLSQDKRVIENFLYFLNALTSKEVFKEWKPFLKKYLIQRKELNGNSVQEILFRNITEMNADAFYKFILSIHEFSKDSKFSLNALTKEIVTLLNSDTNREVLGLVDAWSKSSFTNANVIVQLNSFKESIQLFSELSQDGKLKELLNNLQKIIGRKSEKIEITRIESTVKSFESIEARASTRTQKKWNPPLYKNSNFKESCGKLKLGFDYRNSTKSEIRSQIQAFAKCINSDGKNSELEFLIKELVNPIQETSFFNLIQNFTNDMLASKKSNDAFSDLLFKKENQDALFSGMSILTNLFDKQEINKTSLFEDIFNFIKIQNDDLNTAQYSRFGKILSNFILDNSSVESRNEYKVDSIVLDYFKNAFSNQGSNEIPEVLNPAIPNIIEVRKQFADKYYQYKIGNSEAQEFSIRLDDYYNNIRNGIRKKNFNSLKDYKNTFTPIVSKLAAPNQVLAKSLLEFFKSLNQNPYSLEYVNRWLSRSSGNVRAIEYYYPEQIPGEDKPSIILVNDLDMLELVANNADFTLSELGQFGGGLFENPNVNFAIKYFSKLAQSPNDMSGFVKEANDDISKYLKWVSFPGSSIIVKDELKRRIVNLHNVLGILGELNERVDNQNGLQDLRLLRDLFKYTLNATPKSKWNVYDREINSLAVIVDLAEVGIFRMFSPSMWVESENRGAKAVSIRKILRIISEFANYKNSAEIVRGLLVPKNNLNIVDKMIEALYSIQLYSPQKLNVLKVNLNSLVNVLNTEPTLELFFDFVYKGMKTYEQIQLELPLSEVTLEILSKKVLDIQFRDLYIVKKFISLLEQDEDFNLAYRWVSKLFTKNKGSLNALQVKIDIYLKVNQVEVEILKNWISKDADSMILLESALGSIAKQSRNNDWIFVLQEVLKNPAAYSNKFEILATPKMQRSFKELIQELSRSVIDSYP